MSSIPFEEIATSKRVPASAKILELLSKSDIVKERYSVSLQPYSGSNVGIGGGRNSRVIFKMFNNSDYADLSTAYLTFSSTFRNDTSQNFLQHMNFEDNVLSWFNLCRVLINDQVVEEIANFNIWVNLLTYASMSKSYYETSGSFSGLYRHSTYLTGGPRGAVYGRSDASTTAVVGTFTTTSSGATATPQGAELWAQIKDGAPSWVPNTASTTAGPTKGSGGLDTWVNTAILDTSNNSEVSYWSVPLGGYLGTFSLDKYFPLRSVASVAVELTLPTNIYGVLYDNLLPTAVVNASVGNATLALDNLYLHYDCVKMSDAYYELMDQELVNPNGLGVQFVVNTVESTSVPIATGNSKKTLIASKGTRFLKSLYMVQVPNAATALTGIMPPSSLFCKMGFSSAQLVVNSKRFPQYNIDNVPRAYQELAKSFGKFNSIVGDSIITYNKYDLDITANTDLSAQQDMIYSCFILGFNLEQVLDSDVQLQGENSLTGGFQIAVELTSNALQAATAFIFPHFSKVIKIKAGTVSILN
jgi:hypothetical protein